MRKLPIALMALFTLLFSLPAAAFAENGAPTTGDTAPGILPFMLIGAGAVVLIIVAALLLRKNKGDSPAPADADSNKSDCANAAFAEAEADEKPSDKSETLSPTDEN